MTPQELLKKCDEFISHGESHVQIIIPKGQTSVIKGFGRGVLCCITQNQDRVFWYDAQKVKNAVLKLMGNNDTDNSKTTS